MLALGTDGESEVTKLEGEIDKAAARIAKIRANATDLDKFSKGLKLQMSTVVDDLGWTLDASRMSAIDQKGLVPRAVLTGGAAGYVYTYFSEARSRLYRSQTIFLEKISAEFCKRRVTLYR